MISLQAVLRNLIDGGIEPGDPRTSDLALLRRIRTVNGCCLSLLGCAPTTLLLYAGVGAWKACLGIVLSCVVTTTALVGMRRGWRVEVSTHVTMASLMALLAFLALLSHR